MMVDKQKQEAISEKERIKALEEKCAKLRDRIAKEDEINSKIEWEYHQFKERERVLALKEKYAKFSAERLNNEEEVRKRRDELRREEEIRKQEEFNEILQKRIERREHAKKKKDISKQKKTERDENERIKIEKEIERKDKLACLVANLIAIAAYKKKVSDDFEKIGAEIFLFNFNQYVISTTENIIVDELFSLLNKYNNFRNLSYEYEKLDISERFAFHRRQFIRECFIKDFGGNDLIEMVLIDEDYEGECSITLIQESNYKIVFNKGNYEKQAENFLFCYLKNRKIKQLENSLTNILESGIKQLPTLFVDGKTIEERVCSALESSDYGFIFDKQIECIKDSDMLVLDYELPKTSDISKVKEYKYVLSTKEINTKHYSESYLSKRYEDALYSIALRSIYEVFSVDAENEIKGITFNGFVTQVNPATGIAERKCILSIQVDRERFLRINLAQVEPKACFKALKGVSAAKLIDISPVVPILTFNKKDKRFVDSKHVDVSQGTNLAAMHWEDFEQLVRELFEMEFANNGGEVRVTQASRDGGVDAIVFDPDPLRGGKIVIQAKRYTNTVGVSAVRDLYGTVINEGANTGILITTSDYGHDSYEFAKDKPLKLLNGGHLLALLHKNGKKAHIDIEEAKKLNEKLYGR